MNRSSLWLLFYLALGTVFGLVLSRSGAADYNYIQGMFLFEEFQLYGIIGTAVVVTAPGLYLLKRHGKSASGEPIRFDRKPGHRGNLYGGILFGIGWSITGMCPGPILVNIGEGKIYALAALAGTLVGAGAFGTLYPRLQNAFRLPPLQVGTGEG
ncbi:MAG: DUF6691 family protein [Dehalococcoidia bacterium]